MSERRWELGKKSRHFFNLHLHNSNEWEKYDREISALFQHTVKNILILFFCCSTHVSFSHLSLYLPSSHHLIVDTAAQHSISKNKSILSTSDKFNLKRVLSKKRKKITRKRRLGRVRMESEKMFLILLVSINLVHDEPSTLSACFRLECFCCCYRLFSHDFPSVSPSLMLA